MSVVTHAIDPARDLANRVKIVDHGVMVTKPLRSEHSGVFRTWHFSNMAFFALRDNAGAAPTRSLRA
jgi:ABC-type polar amino acid transport system ATPase subunit